MYKQAQGERLRRGNDQLQRDLDAEQRRQMEETTERGFYN